MPVINSKYHVVHTESSGGWGGQEIRILSEALEFIKNGYSVTLICDFDTPIAKRSKKHGIPTVELPIGKKSLKGLLALKSWIVNNEFDVINTHSSSDSWMVAVGMRLAFKAKPLVRTRHVSAPVSNNMATSWLYQKAANRIVTTGEKLKQTLIRDNQILPKKIISIPTGIDCELFVPSLDKESIRSSLGLPVDKIIIGIVATLRSWKGHSYLIDAFKSIDNSNLHLLIVGNGPQWDNIVEKTDSLELTEKVTLCGDQENVVPWLQSMDIFVLPSYANEGVPQGLMQAMACGLPVISTDVGSITEIVCEGTNGLVVPIKDSVNLGYAIESLINNKELRDVFGLQGYQKANKQFGLDIMFKKMNSVFLEVINETRK